MQNDDNTEPTTPDNSTTAEDKSDQAPHPFELLIGIFREDVADIMGIPPEEFSLEVATFDNIQPVIRVHHRKVLASGLDWMGIVSITTTWKSDEGSRVELSSHSTVRQRYLKQVAEMADLDLFRSDLNPITSHRFFFAKRAERAEREVFAEDAAATDKP